MENLENDELIDLTNINFNDMKFRSVKRHLFTTQNIMLQKGANLLWIAVKKYGLKIDNSYVSESKIVPNERGLFAKRKLVAGDIITIYPADLAFERDNMNDNHSDKISSMTLVGEKYYNYRFSGKDDEYNPEVMTNEFNNYFKSYLLELTDKVTIAGHPDLIDDNSYVGHMINDASILLKKDKKYQEKYLKSSNEGSNCEFKFCNYVRFIVATKDIEQDEEILVSYGVKYWLSKLK